MAKTLDDTGGNPQGSAPRPRYVVSGCLAGLCCRYDGGSNPCPQVVALVEAGLAVPVCPESLSGLPVPRPPCEQALCGHDKGEIRVLSRSGEDVTRAFELGADRAFRAALATGCREAILKARSPSCGVGHVYDGSFSHRLRPGDGLWARLLREAGFRLWTEDDLPPGIADQNATP
ncbi:MAG: DUF523 domain-containing protein [Desulfovibrio sp.]|nr:DUF523 domain-containing protein [Desulfovibrio sp.]